MGSSFVVDDSEKCGLSLFYLSVFFVLFVFTGCAWASDLSCDEYKKSMEVGGENFLYFSPAENLVDKYVNGNCEFDVYQVASLQQLLSERGRHEEEKKLVQNFVNKTNNEGLDGSFLLFYYESALDESLNGEEYQVKLAEIVDKKTPSPYADSVVATLLFSIEDFLTAKYFYNRALTNFKYPRDMLYMLKAYDEFSFLLFMLKDYETALFCIEYIKKISKKYFTHSSDLMSIEISSLIRLGKNIEANKLLAEYEIDESELKKFGVSLKNKE